MIPVEAVEAAARALYQSDGLNLWGKEDESTRAHYARKARAALEAAAPHMRVVELAAEYRRGYRDGLTDRKQVTAEPRAWEPGDPIE